jgi:nucleotide-binding universal stress UspA family protein
VERPTVGYLDGMAAPENEHAGRPAGTPVHTGDPVDDLRTEDRERDQEIAGRAQGEGAARARRVVVGIDGSAESRAALHWAVGQAQRMGAEVQAVAVWHEPLQFGVGGMSRVPAQHFEDEARGWLAEVMPEEADASGVHVDTHIRRGEPATVLLDHALRADLLVVGNRGRGGLAGAMVGSVALRIAHHARCPVVLVPAPRNDG